MAFPPPTLPINRTDATAQSGTHPADHNAANAAINDTVARLQALIAQVGTGETAFATAPLGMLARTYGAAVPSIVGATELCRVSFAAKANRWYRTTLTIPNIINNATIGYQLVASIGDQLGQTIAAAVQYVGNGEYATITLQQIETWGADAAIERRLIVTPQGGPFAVNVGGGPAYSAPWIAVEDMGAV